MAFKMKRAGMNLRSSSSIRPQLTALGSPLKQAATDTPITGAVFNESTYSPSGSGVSGSRSSQGSQAEQNEIIKTAGPSGKNAPDDEWLKTCEENPCLDACDKQFGKCNQGAVDPVTETGEGDLSVDVPVTQGNMLTPREMSRNTRATDIFRKRQEDLIRRANKDFRQATRRGESHDPKSGYMKILSGELLGDMDGVNIGQASTGTTNLFTGQKTYKFNPKSGGGKKNLQDELNAELQKEKYKKMNPDEGIKMAQQIVSDAYMGSGKVKVFNQGQHLSSRSRSLADNRNYNTDDYGDFGKDKLSEKKRMSNARDSKEIDTYLQNISTPVTETDKNGKEITTYKYNPKNEEGISERKYDLKRRKLNKKTGKQSSAFKKKESPLQMTVNITKPSYKMGGFGSK